MAELKASIQIRAEDRSSAALEKVAKGSKKLEGRLAAARKELLDLDRKDSAVRKLESLGKGLGRTASKFDLARRRTAELRRQIRASEKPTKALTREFEAARRKSSALSASHRRQRDELRALRAELRGAGIDTRKLGDAQGRIAAGIERATRRMDRMGEAAQRVSRAQKRLDRTAQRAASASLVAGELRNFGQGALGLLAAPLRGVRQVERARGELASLGMSRDAIDLVARRGRDLSRRVAGVTTPVFTGAAYDIRSGISSLDAAGVADFTELAALTSKATKADLGQMTSLFATSHGAFMESLFRDSTDLEFGEAFAAQLAKSVEQFKTDGSKMQQAIESMGSGMAAAGVPLEQQLAALGLLQKKMAPGRAGTVMQALERSAADAQDAFEESGRRVRTLDERDNMLAPTEMLREIKREFGDEWSTAIGAEIKKAFGSDEAKEFFAALWEEEEALEEGVAAQAAAAAEGKGGVQRMVDAAQGNLDDRLVLLQQRWDTLAEVIGESLIPVLDWAIPRLDSLIGGIETFAERHPKITAALTAITGGVGLLALAISPAIFALGSLKWAIDRLRLSSARTALGGAGGGGSLGAPPVAGGKSGRRGLPGRIRDLARGGPKGAGGRIGDFARSKRKLAASLLKGRAGWIGAGIGALTIGGTLLNDELSGGEKAAAVSTEAGGIGGALAGAAAGAALGSVVPVIGTVIGGILGSILGGWAGSSLGSRAGRLFHDPDAPEVAESAGEAAGETSRRRRSFREMRGLDRSPLSGRGPEPSLEQALAGIRREEGEAAARAAARSGDRTVNITNRITIERRAGESAEAFADRLLRLLERKQALAGREALGDAY